MEIVPAGIEAYEELGRFHYRSGRVGPYAGIFAIREMHPVRSRLGQDIVGVIVYTMPVPALELRNFATGGIFSGFERQASLQIINDNIRCIGRVIIEPRYRSLGLASWLVAETMPRMSVSIIEAMAVMGQVNPFFERAGMRPYAGKISARCVKLTEALGMVGIEGENLVDAQAVQRRLDSLNKIKAEFIEIQIRSFLQCYGKRREMPGGIERTKFVLGKLTFRPVYYIWFNPESAFGRELTSRSKQVEN